MRLRTTAILATAAAAATSLALLAGCGGSASEATSPTATSTTVVRQAAAGNRPSCYPNCRGANLTNAKLIRADLRGAGT